MFFKLFHKIKREKYSRLILLSQYYPGTAIRKKKQKGKL
jgi:hypothetical protein